MNYIGLENTRPDGVYIKILGSDGTFRVEVAPQTPRAVVREYEQDDVKKIKHELVYHKLTGKIENISFRDGNYGRTIDMFIRNDKALYIVSVNTANNYASSIMKVLPNLNLEKEVVFKPYAFKGDNGKDLKGVSVEQDGEKILNYFWDKKKKEVINDFPVNDEEKKPEATATTKWKKYWKAYFSDVEEFLVEYTEEKIIPNLPEIEVPEEVQEEEADDNLDGWGDDEAEEKPATKKATKKKK